jgi:hypothetical protein
MVACSASPVRGTGSTARTPEKPCCPAVMIVTYTHAFTRALHNRVPALLDRPDSEAWRSDATGPTCCDRRPMRTDAPARPLAYCESTYVRRQRCPAVDRLRSPREKWWARSNPP